MKPIDFVDIVIVDDNYNNLSLLTKILANKHYKIRKAINGRVALRAIQASLPHLILLDINLPDMTGYEVCKQLKSDPTTQAVPVIFISALNETIDKVTAFAVGGVDYITKPFEMAEVIARIENQLSLQAAQAKIQHLNMVLEERVCQRSTQLELANQALQTEMQERQQAQDQLLHALRHDPLTNLPNLAGLRALLNHAIAQLQQNSLETFALIVLGCDHFQLINSSLGHHAGDQVLLELSQRLATCLPANSHLARLGEDKFLVFLENAPALTAVEQLAQQLQQTLAPAFQAEQQEIFVTASMGIIVGTPEYTQPEHLLRDADTAMYQAKRAGKAQYKIFSAEMHHQAQERLRLETDLRRSLERQELRLHYQPILSLTTGQVDGFEALVRWQHPTRGMISPGLFIPIAEETGLIVPIGTWVLQTACKHLKTWQQTLPLNAAPNFKISVNCSIKQFLVPNLIEEIDDILQETGLDGQFLKLEITESAFMENAALTEHLLWQLKARQIQLVIDDFGTGYSSLSYLHRFPVDTLKIDRSFIQHLSAFDQEIAPPSGHNQNFRIVQSIIKLAQDLGMDVVAEGIEVQQQIDILTKLNCDFGQGFFWSKPLDYSLATAVLRSHLQPLTQPIVSKV